MKNFKKNSIILVLITLLILFLVLKDDFNNIVHELVNANFLYIILAFICLLLMFVFDGLAYYKIIKSYDKNYSFIKVLRMLIITKFFNGITPFSTGGQPMQVYMLKKDGFRLTKASNIIIQNFIIYQAALVLYGLIAMAINAKFNYFKNITILKDLIILGFLINTGVMIGLFIISFSNKFNHFIVNKSINILSKLLNSAYSP